ARDVAEAAGDGLRVDELGVAAGERLPEETRRRVRGLRRRVEDRPRQLRRLDGLVAVEDFARRELDDVRAVEARLVKAVVLVPLRVAVEEDRRAVAGERGPDRALGAAGDRLGGLAGLGDVAEINLGEA